MPAPDSPTSPASPTPPASPAPSKGAAADDDEKIYLVDGEDSASPPGPAGSAGPAGSSATPAASLNRGQPVMMELRHIHKSFGEKKVLVDISLEVRRSDTLCVVGGSGCGKSTLLRVMSGLTPPDDTKQSEVLLGGENLLSGDRDALDRARGKLGMVFQYAALLASYTVFENVALPLLERGDLKRAEIRDRVADVLEKVHLPGSEDLMPAELSGGMRKRVGIARAVVTRPDVILFDEPTSGLDPIMTANFDQLVIELKETLHLTSVVVSHDLNSVYRIANRVVMLHGGHKVIDGTPESFRNDPHPAIQQFVQGAPSGPGEE
ncbi:MAG: ABC transporter ATP-binding protein [Planctomycetota bacterium]